MVTTTSDKYADCFGFTEEEVRNALTEMGYDDFDGVKRWYDGFNFGKVKSGSVSVLGDELYQTPTTS